MARTKASVGAKISSGKSSKARCAAAPAGSGGSSGNTDKSSRGSGGGNPVCPRETPKWQKPITNFLINRHNDGEDKRDGEAAGSSKPKPKPKRNIILSDDESPEKPKNSVLEESIVLEELNGEDSHKIEEYIYIIYTKESKGKGAAKKTKKTNRVGSKRATETENTDDVKGEEEIENDEEEIENDEKETGNDEEMSENDEEEIENDEKETENDEEMSENNEEKTENDEEETENDEKVNKVEDNLKKDLTKTVDKENIDSNKKSNTNDKDNNNKNKNKREREDELEEGNVRKKIKIK